MSPSLMVTFAAPICPVPSLPQEPPPIDPVLTIGFCPLPPIVIVAFPPLPSASVLVRELPPPIPGLFARLFR